MQSETKISEKDKLASVMGRFKDFPRDSSHLTEKRTRQKSFNMDNL